MITHSSPKEEPSERIAFICGSCGNQLTPDYLINSRLEGLGLQLLEATNLELAEQKAEDTENKRLQNSQPPEIYTRAFSKDLGIAAEEGAESA